LIQSQGEFAAKGLGKHVVGRSLYAMESHGAKSLWGYLFTLPFYFLTFFLSFAPWAFWTPRALQFHRNQPSDLSRYLLCGVLLTFVLFTLSRTKLPHYTLPCFPFIALLLSLDSGHPDRAAALRKALGWTGAIFVAVPLLAFGKIQSLSVSDAIVERLEDVLPPEAEVALVDYQEPSLIWDLRRTLRTFPKTLPANEIASWLAQPGPRCCILSDAIARTIEGPWIRREAAGWNLAKGRRIRLVALTPPPNEAAPPRQPALAPPITPPKPR
jgi:hypothetical protein